MLFCTNDVDSLCARRTMYDCMALSSGGLYFVFDTLVALGACAIVFPDFRPLAGWAHWYSLGPIHANPNLGNGNMLPPACILSSTDANTLNHLLAHVNFVRSGSGCAVLSCFFLLIFSLCVHRSPSVDEHFVDERDAW